MLEQVFLFCFMHDLNMPLMGAAFFVGAAIPIFINLRTWPRNRMEHMHSAVAIWTIHCARVFVFEFCNLFFQVPEKQKLFLYPIKNSFQSIHFNSLLVVVGGLSRSANFDSTNSFRKFYCRSMVSGGGIHVLKF